MDGPLPRVALELESSTLPHFPTTTYHKPVWFNAESQKQKGSGKVSRILTIDVAFLNQTLWNAEAYINYNVDSNKIQDRARLFYSCFKIVMSFTVTDKINEISLCRSIKCMFRQDDSSTFQSKFWFQIFKETKFLAFYNDYIMMTV